MAATKQKGMSSEELSATEEMLRAQLDLKTEAQASMLAKLDAQGLPDFSDWSDEQVGFAPYWKAKQGEFFYGVLMARDDRDTDFIRYLVLAAKDHDCFVGGKDEQKPRKVKAGDYFTVSVWAQLQPKFDEYLAMPFQVPMRCEALYKTETSNAGREVWHWRIQVANETKRLLQAQRKLAYQKQLEARGTSALPA